MNTNPSNCHVLVVEDDEILSSMLVAALDAMAFSFERTASAKEAMTLARRHRPMIVVCDVHLPDGDGRALLREMRADPHLAMVQFVLITGDVEGASPRNGMDLGANDYLAKPFSLEDFESCIRARCRQGAIWRKIEQRSIERMRATVTSVLPHEFFTPLAGIIGLAELLREDFENMPPEQCREFLQDIEDSAYRLRRSMDNYLSILRLREQGALGEREPRETPLSDLLPAFATAAAETAERHNRTDDLQADCAVSGDHRMIYVDGRELGKIVGELVDNACKFSMPGQPVIASLEATGSELKLRVSDTGRGMSAEEISQLGAFHQFHRDRFEQQGLGLGLTLAQYLIDCSGGECTIHSQPGKGTTITVSWAVR